MKRFVLYHLGVFISLAFSVLYTTGYGWIFLAVLVLANQLNKVLGEFSADEIASELSFFDSNTSFQFSKVSVGVYYILWNVWVFWWLGSNVIPGWNLLLFTLGAGIINSTFAISLAHDLLHKKGWLKNLISQVLLMVPFMSFFKNDHLLGHHRLACTKEDIGSAKRNDSFYSYLAKVVPYRIKQSYGLKSHYPSILRKKVLKQNYLLLIVNIGIWGSILVWSNYTEQVFVFLLSQFFVVYVMFEIANYIQHYGLSRNSLRDELTVNHAWDYLYKYTNYISYLLPIHSYHHAPKILKSNSLLVDRKTVLPFCYYKMILLALYPPRWFKVMNPLLDQINGRILRKVAAVLVFFFALSGIHAQHNFGVKYFGLSMHPKGDPQAHLMPYKLDKDAVFVVNFGGILSYQTYVYSNLLSVKVAQGIYTDSGGLISGHTHLGFRARFVDANRHSMILGFGPTLVYRRNWSVKEGYESTGLFKERGNIQYKFVWYGGEIEYNYILNDHWDLSINFLPGYPLVMSFGVGVRYWPQRF